MSRITKSTLLYSLILFATGLLFIILPNILSFTAFSRIILIFVGIFIVLGNLLELKLVLLATKREIFTNIFNIVLGLCLIFFPLTFIKLVFGLSICIFSMYEVLKSNDKMQTFKKNFVKILFGLIILFFAPLAGNVADSIAKILSISIGVLIIVFAFVYLFYGLFGDKIISKRRNKKIIDVESEEIK